mgnify:CR=1 FL=1
MSDYYYKVEEVRTKIEAQGLWLSVLAKLAPDLETALRKPGSHVACPIHKGKHRDGFRLFKDVHLTGGGICNTCGPKHDGFELLSWMRGWNFPETLKAVGDVVGARQYQIKPKTTSNSKGSPSAPRPSQEASAKPGRKRKSGRVRAKGALLQYGEAPFEHNPDNETSFFVTLQTAHGHERTIWGVDLSRALSEADASKGNTVTLISHGRKAVSVERNVVDKETGEVIDVETIQTHRNEWEVLNHSAALADDIELPVVQRAVSNGAVVARSAPASTPIVAPDVEDNEQADEAAPNVVPLFGDSDPAWLAQVKERLERQDKRRKAYGEKILERHHKLWDECLPINASGTTPIHRYFERRGFVVVIDKIAESDSIRFHPALPYFVENDEGTAEEIGKFPAVVGVVQDVDGNLLTLHRTYLSPNGSKAGVREAKKMMAVPDGVDIKGGAIRLGIPEDGILGVAEGMETALSAYRATGIPTWSTVNAQLMKSFSVPDGTHTVIIWADLDRSLTGEIAANALKRRLEKQGIYVLIMIPQIPVPATAKSVDWNDILMWQGREGFPRPDRLRKYIEANRSKAMAKIEYAEALA